MQTPSNSPAPRSRAASRDLVRFRRIDQLRLIALLIREGDRVSHHRLAVACAGTGRSPSSRGRVAERLRSSVLFDAAAARAASVMSRM
jgi:hypothetical protein